MDIAGGAKEGANKGGNYGKWWGLAAGLLCGAIAVTAFFASAGIAIPGIAITTAAGHAMGHATLTAAQLIFPSVVGIGVCAWAGMVLGGLFGGLTGGLFGGIGGVSKKPEPPGGRTRNPPSRDPGLNNQRMAQRIAPAADPPAPMHTPGNNSPEEYGRNLQ